MPRMPRRPSIPVERHFRFLPRAALRILTCAAFASCRLARCVFCRALPFASYRVPPCASWHVLPFASRRVLPFASCYAQHSIPVECRPAHSAARRPAFPTEASFRFLSSASTTMLRALFLRDAGGLSSRSATQRTGVACSIHIGAPDLHAAGLHALDMHAVGCSVVGEAHSTRAGAADRTWSAVNHRALDGESTRPPGTGSPNLSLPVACRACVRRGRHRVPALHG